MKPSIGWIVHYVSYGTPGGEFSRECRAAVVTEIQGPHLTAVEAMLPEKVGLAVLNPTGMFFHPLVRGGCGYHSGEVDNAGGTNLCGGADFPGGTWHWPEKIPQEVKQ